MEESAFAPGLMSVSWAQEGPILRKSPLWGTENSRNLLLVATMAGRERGIVRARLARANPGNPKPRVEGYFCAKSAAAIVSDPGPLAKTLVLPSTPAAMSHELDQQRSSGGQSRAVAPGKAAPM